MGCGWYRTAYYPPEARIERRSIDDLADELVAEIETGVGETGDPARDHRRDRHRQAVGLAGGGAGPPRGGACGTPDRAGHHDPRASCPTSGSPSSGSSRRRGSIRPGSSSATPIRTRSSTTTSRSSSEAPASNSTSSACPGSASGSARTRTVELAVRAPRPRPRRPRPPQPGRLQRLAARALRGQRLRVPRRDLPPAPAGGRRVRRRDRDDDGREPAAAPDDRVDRRAPPGARLSPRASPRRSARRCRSARR